MHRRQSWFLASELNVEIARVRMTVLSSVQHQQRDQSLVYSITNNGREVWWWNSFVEDVVKVDILEEGVPLDFFCISLTGTQATLWVSGQQLDQCQDMIQNRQGKGLPFAKQTPHPSAW